LQGYLTNTKQSRVNSDEAQDVLKSTVFSCYRKAASDCSSLMKYLREFHAQAAAAGNARSPRVRRRVAGTISVDVTAERRRLQKLRLVVRCKVSATVALCHVDIGKPEHRVETLTSLKLSTNGVHGVAE